MISMLFILEIQYLQLNGEARFFICVQDNLGRKNLNRHFRGALSISATVTSEDGSQVTAYDDTTVVSRVLVELEFAEDTRKHFKPGIAFQGQVCKIHSRLSWEFCI